MSNVCYSLQFKMSTFILLRALHLPLKYLDPNIE